MHLCGTVKVTEPLLSEDRGMLTFELVGQALLDGEE